MKEQGKLVQADELAKLLSKGFEEVAQTLNLAKLDIAPEIKISNVITNKRLEKIGEKLGATNLDDALAKGKEKVVRDSRTQAKRVVKKQAKPTSASEQRMNSFLDSIKC